jgi:hypothetical protein
MVLYWVLTFAMSSASRLQSNGSAEKAGFKPLCSNGMA